MDTGLWCRLMHGPGKGELGTEKKEELVLQGQETCGVGIKIGREGDARADLRAERVFAGQPEW